MISNSTGFIGTPLVVSGQAATSTTVTYRYFLKDSNTSNTTGLFSTGAVTIQFDGTWRTVDLTVGESGQILSSHYRDQWDAYYVGRSFPMQFHKVQARHTLTVNPR